MATQESRSDSPRKCGLCGGRADPPARFTNDDVAQSDGVFNVCNECGAECTGTAAYTVKDRWYWTDAKTVDQGRRALEAAERDAEWAECQRWEY